MAIKALAWMVRSFPAPVYCYHEIVHNRIVVDRFEQLGVVFVDDIADVPEGSPIMLSAHGSAPEVVAAASDARGDRRPALPDGVVDIGLIAQADRRGLFLER
jgi:4-hydroxy-3-methylbut-2-enyl diphosphate reductase